ncbi:hypothetical protein FUA23_10105 [Neolewinella aurantiaca]|uniref:Uncharacterized protein n=1 Tax=Neolewinella aurantiaca TaxID=2602767 RepID=A0A5C7FPD1_9BACT|nr:hypothetical protein [Neolewinella aurantiaca]TXF89548.1 hypothetical protein FUA23_10105 [Neolewinella aurantiaca]
MANSIVDTLIDTVKDAVSSGDTSMIQQFSGGSIDSVEEFMRKTEHTGPKNYGRGFLAGVLGGIAGVAVKMAVDHYAAPNTDQIEDKVADNLVDKAEELTGIDLDEDGENAAAAIIEVGIGALMGGVYGLIVEAMPEAKTEASAEDGGGVFATVQQLAVPAMGVMPAAAKDIAKDKFQNLAGHVAFGATVEIVRRTSRYYMEQ